MPFDVVLAYLVLAAPPPPDFDWLDPCKGVSIVDFPWCNTALSPKERAAALVGNMTLLEKVRIYIYKSQPDSATTWASRPLANACPVR